MTTSFVGLENLPNVYFRDISISSINDVEGQQKFSRVEITLVVKDTTVDGKLQWSSDDLLNSYLDIKIIQSMNQDFTNEMTSGQYTLYDFDYKNSVNYDENTIKSIKKRLRPQAAPEAYLVENNIYEFEYKFSFDILDSMLVDVSYFAAIIVNLEMMGTDFSADFSSSEIRYYQGPITSELIFVDGVLQTKTNVFYLPDNQVWAGPVHVHEGEYMAGAFHTPRPHPVLKLAQVDNLMLKDKRNLKYENKNIFDKSQKLLVGSPYDTTDEFGNIKRLLSFNIESIFLEKTKYGSIIRQIDEALYNKSIQEFVIHNMTMTRNFVKKSNLSEVLASRSNRCLIYAGNNIEKAVLSDECDIMPIMTGNNKYKYFSFVDKKIKSLKYGNYTHSVEILFKDKTKNFLESLVENYRTDISNLERYYIRSANEKSKTSNKFSKKFLDKEARLYNLDNPENSNLVPWLRAPENYANLNSYMYTISSDDKIKIYNSSYKSINPETGTLDAISSFIENYKQLVGEFTSKFDLSKKMKGTFQRRSVPRKTGIDNPAIYVRIKKDYKNIFAPTKNKPGYTIFERNSNEDNGILTLSRQDFDNIRKEEKSRFFISQPNLNFEESQVLSEDEIEPLSDIETYSCSYFSPRKFILGSKKIDLRQTNIINNKLLNDTISSLNKKRKRRALFSKSASIHKLRSSPRKNISNDPERSFQNASDYLGEQSKFLDLSSEFATEDLGLIQKILVREKFLTSKSKTTKKKLSKSFDLTKKDNIIFRKKRATGATSKTDEKRKAAKKYRSSLRKIPNHLKAMITSRSSNVRTNLLMSPTDLLASGEQNNALLIQHFAVKQIEYFHGFTKDKKGNPIFGYPDWRPLDLNIFKNNINRTLICRATQYTDELLEINIPDELDFQLFDKYFIILPDAPDIEAQTTERGFAYNTASSLMDQKQINYDYTTTNPVVQPAKENGIFTDPPEPLVDSARVNSSNKNSSLSSRQRRGRQRRPRGTTNPNRGTGY